MSLNCLDVSSFEIIKDYFIKVDAQCVTLF